jgi:hypothetical protein
VEEEAKNVARNLERGEGSNKEQSPMAFALWRLYAQK